MGAQPIILGGERRGQAGLELMQTRSCATGSRSTGHSWIWLRGSAVCKQGGDSGQDCLGNSGNNA